MGNRIYLVEDSPKLRNLIQQAIENIGAFQVVGSAACAATAIREIEELVPDIAIVDLELKKGSGWDVLDGTSAVPTRMILTNHNLSLFRAEAKRRGITHFFDKSLEFDLFLETLRKLSVESDNN